jgi:hypothetical protein
MQNFKPLSLILGTPRDKGTKIVKESAIKFRLNQKVKHTVLRTALSILLFDITLDSLAGGRSAPLAA